MITQLWWRSIRFGFRLLYHELAWTYDLVSWVVSLGQWRQWQMAALPFVTGQTILELAHGPGHMLSALETKGHRAVGIDLSLYMSRQARRRLLKQGRTPRLAQARAQALPFAAGTFDTVLATFPTDYIAAPETLRAAARVLKPTGRLVIVPEGHLTGKGVAVRFLTWLFVITGQRPAGQPLTYEAAVELSPYGQHLRHHVEQLGFRLQFHPVELSRSGCTVIVAEKSVIVSPRGSS